MSTESLPVVADLFINGEFVKASDEGSFDLYSPYNEKHVGKSSSLLYDQRDSR